MSNRIAIPPTLQRLDRLRKNIEAECRAIAPADLAGRPLYVVLGSQLAAETAGDRLYGCTLNSLDLIARPHLDVWHGRGPAFLINDRAIFADTLTLHPYAVRSAILNIFERTCREIAIHEFSHILERGTARGEAPSPAIMAAVRSEFCRASEGTDATATAPRIDLQHGPRWIRLVVHAVHRANSNGGRCLALENVAGNIGRGLSPASHYAMSLADEPERMADRRFSEIVAMPVPRTFDALWASDVEILTAANAA